MAKKRVYAELADQPKKSKAKANQPRKKNKVARLVVEILVVLGVIAGVVLVRIAPELDKAISEADPYQKYRALYDEALAYDYSKGRNADLEYRIDKSVQNKEIGVEQMYFNQMARGYYYCSLGYQYLGLNAFRYAVNYISETDGELASDAFAAYSACNLDDGNI